MILVVVVCIGLFVLVGTVHTALYGPRAQARKRLRGASRDLVDGAVVTLTGKVIAKTKRVEAPLSGREGVAYAASARIYTSVGRMPGQRSAEVVETMMVEFELQTNDDVVLVLGEEPQIALPGAPLIPRRLDREQRFLRIHGYAAVNAQAAGFDEVVIEPGMKISVHGVVRIEPVASADYRATATRIVVSGDPAHPLTIGRPV